MKNCGNCKNKLIKFGHKGDDFELLSDNISSCLGSMYGKCLAGNTEQLVEFFKEFGGKNKSQYEDIEYLCYEGTEIDKLIDLVDSMLKKNS